jgi:hypothetical protein
MDYREHDGAFHHPNRRAIFVGDFIDRGPQQRDVLHIAMRMGEAGSALAVMGNHEFNALCWAEPESSSLRGALATKQSSLSALLWIASRALAMTVIVGSHPRRRSRGGFTTPAPDRRGVRSPCEGTGLVQNPSGLAGGPGTARGPRLLESASPGNSSPPSRWGHRFTKAGLRAAARKGTKAYDAAEILPGGPEARLPGDRTFADKQGTTRRDVRLRWWDPEATTFPKAALGMDRREAELPDLPVTTAYHDTETTPVLFGHYWLQGKPVIAAGHAACLDYSVAKKGFLTAYRWSGEAALSQENVVYVSA